MIQNKIKTLPPKLTVSLKETAFILPSPLLTAGFKKSNPRLQSASLLGCE
jgi:hypothetical protein